MKREILISLICLLFICGCGFTSTESEWLETFTVGDKIKHSQLTGMTMERLNGLPYMKIVLIMRVISI